MDANTWIHNESVGQRDETLYSTRPVCSLPIETTRACTLCYDEKAVQRSGWGQARPKPQGLTARGTGCRVLGTPGPCGLCTQTHSPFAQVFLKYVYAVLLFLFLIWKTVCLLRGEFYSYQSHFFFTCLLYQFDSWRFGGPPMYVTRDIKIREMIKTDASSLIWQHHKVHTNPLRTLEWASTEIQETPPGREGRVAGKGGKGEEGRWGAVSWGHIQPTIWDTTNKRECLKKCPALQNNVQKECNGKATTNTYLYYLRGWKN